MKAKPIRVLLIEDDPDDYLLTRDLLAEIPVRPFELEWKKSYEEGLEALCSGEHEVCLLDYRLGKRNGLELLHQAERCCQINGARSAEDEFPLVFPRIRRQYASSSGNEPNEFAGLTAGRA